MHGHRGDHVNTHKYHKLAVITEMLMKEAIRTLPLLYLCIGFGCLTIHLMNPPNKCGVDYNVQ